MKKIDLTGQRFGKRRVMEPKGIDRNGNRLWLVRCDCSNENIVSHRALNITESCRDCVHKVISLKKRKDLVGKHYGPYEVLARELAESGRSMWRVRCKSGHESIIYTHALKAAKRCFQCAFPDLTGTKCGSLYVIGKDGNGESGSRLYRVKCENCENETTMTAQNIRKAKRCVKCKGSGQIEKGRAAFNRLFKRYQINAETKGISFDLSADQFRAITQQSCFFCGCPPSRSVMEGSPGKPFYGDFIYNGIDRVDCDLGYTEANCRWAACNTCNMMRGTMTVDAFLKHIRSIVNHSGQINTKEFADLGLPVISTARTCAFNRAWRTYVDNAARRNCSFSLSKETFCVMLQSCCGYCGRPPSTQLHGTVYNGIDRIDSSDGYSKNNVVTACKFCNTMKRDLSVEQFKAHVRTIAEYSTVT